VWSQPHHSALTHLDLVDVLGKAQERAAAADNDALLHRGLGGVESVLHPQLLLLQLRLRLRAHL